MMKTVTTWKEKHQFQSLHDHNSIDLDGSNQHGFGPKALMLSALAACSGIDVVDLLGKMRVEFFSLEIDAMATQTDEHPKVFKEVELVYKVKMAPGNEDKLKKAIDLSLDKYCGVAAMLKKNSPVNYKMVIES